MYASVRAAGTCPIWLRAINSQAYSFQRIVEVGNAHGLAAGDDAPRAVASRWWAQPLTRTMATTAYSRSECVVRSRARSRGRPIDVLPPPATEGSRCGVFISDDVDQSTMLRTAFPGRRRDSDPRLLADQRGADCPLRPRIDAGCPGSGRRLPVFVTVVPSTLKNHASLG